MSDTETLTPRLPVSSAPTVTAADGIGVRARVRDGLGLATVLARKGAGATLGRRIRERYALDLQTGPRRSETAEAAFAGTGPGAWLAISEQGGNAFAAKLARDLEGVASVSDQSDGYLVVRLSGARVREALSKLVPLDLHPRAFHTGDVASTVASHISVTLWRLADEPGVGAVFEVILFRSLARSFWHALGEAGAEFGFSGTAPAAI